MNWDNVISFGIYLAELSGIAVFKAYITAYLCLMLFLFMSSLFRRSNR